jgi:uncharacterized lipoprotein YmbA
MIARSGRCPGLRFSIAALIGLTLCAGCIGHSAPPRFYVLTDVSRSTVAAPSAEPGRGAAVGVGPVALPGYLDRIQIVTRRGAQLEVAELDRWGEPLSEGVPRAIAAHLAALLQTDRIVVYPWPGARTIEHQVVIDVTRFDGAPGSDVLLEARWRVLGHDRKELVLRYSAVREATGESGYLPLVAAMSRSVGALSREIADSVKMLRAQPAR